MRYKCNRCGYETDYTTNFKKHLSTKKICKVTCEDIDPKEIYKNYFEKDSSNECNICNKKFKTYDYLQTHIAKYHTHEKLETKLNQIVTLLDKLNKEDRYQIINQTNNSNNNNINIFTCNFLQENIDYISKTFIMDCAKKLDNGLIDFIKTIRFNPEHPENMTVKLHIKRDRTLYVYRNNKWEICDSKWTLEEMIIHGARIIYQTFLTNSDKEKLLEEESSESFIQNWFLSVLPKNDNKLMTKLSKRLYALVLDNQELLLVEQPIDLLTNIE